MKFVAILFAPFIIGLVGAGLVLAACGVAILVARELDNFAQFRKRVRERRAARIEVPRAVWRNPPHRDATPVEWLRTTE